MAKRARGSVRPGQRRPVTKRPATQASATPAAAAAATPKPAGLSEAELERAAQLETQLLAEEKAAETARTRSKQRTASPARDYLGSGTIAVRAETEYAYVARDVKDIIRVAAILFTTLIVLWLLIDVTQVISLGG